jgi:hypothetical protein
VRVDEAWTARVESRQVDLGDGIGRHRRDIGVRIETVVDGVHVDIVDVEEQLAARPSRDGGDEFPFGQRRIVEGDVRRDVFDGDLAPRRSWTSSMREHT